MTHGDPWGLLPPPALPKKSPVVVGAQESRKQGFFGIQSWTFWNVCFRRAGALYRQSPALGLACSRPSGTTSESRPAGASGCFTSPFPPALPGHELWESGDQPGLPESSVPSKDPGTWRGSTDVQRNQDWVDGWVSYVPRESELAMPALPSPTSSIWLPSLPLKGPFLCPSLVKTEACWLCHSTSLNLHCLFCKMRLILKAWGGFGG